MQGSTDRRIGWNFKGDAGIHGPLNWSEFSKRDPRTVESVGIFEGGRRYWRTAESVRFFKARCKNSRTAESVRILKGMQGSTNRRIGTIYESGMHGPPNRSEFSKRTWTLNHLFFYTLECTQKLVKYFDSYKVWFWFKSFHIRNDNVKTKMYKSNWRLETDRIDGTLVKRTLVSNGTNFKNVRNGFDGNKCYRRLWWCWNVH